MHDEKSGKACEQDGDLDQAGFSEALPGLGRFFTWGKECGQDGSEALVVVQDAGAKLCIGYKGERGGETSPSQTQQYPQG